MEKKEVEKTIEIQKSTKAEENKKIEGEKKIEIKEGEKSDSIEVKKEERYKKKLNQFKI